MYENIALILIGLVFILLYLYDREKTKDIEDKNMLMRHVFLAAGLGFLLMSLIFNFNIITTSTVTSTTGNVTGITSIANTIYIYSNSVVDITAPVLIYIVIFAVIIILVLARMAFDILDAIQV